MPYADPADQAAARRRHYEKDRAAYSAQARAWVAANRERDRANKAAYKRRLRAWLDEIKRSAGCTDCGTREGRLDFDHRPGTEKLFNPMRLDRGRAALEAEVAKCDVRCVRCHAARHGRERGGLNG